MGLADVGHVYGEIASHDAETLCNVIERSCRLRALLTNQSLQQRIGTIEKLPSLPKLYHDLMSAMGRPEVSCRMVADIIERDSAMSAKILQLANSAYFGATKSISRIDHAIVYLGLELVKNLALSVHVFASLTEQRVESSLESLQEHAIRTARVAKRLLPAEQKAQQAFTAALLHDVGQVVLAVCIPEGHRQVVETSRRSGRPLHEVETEVLGVDHAAAGAYLLGLWGLPFPIVEAVAYHHDPGGAGERTFDVASATALADSLVEAVTSSNASAIDSSHLQELNVLTELPRWTEIAQQELSAERIVID